ncbi:hypothetical protein R1CP_36330 (plasmid) [Rhodococcus opacus]|uniref:NAD(P)-binding domain-containing protein n=1 Tax=Rhodococcus opacus TaxID=37919 RepID=A0A1B1KGX6_RHOOP|nr:NAD(P)H-binding protein [Rhodococcus opacus]ANS31872.1 hypothetical protein R1CP_36330 [Rhodococcus opacus]
MTDKRVVIAGGHGKIAQHLTAVLTAQGDRSEALIRNPAHIGAVTKLGALPQVVDMESASVDQVAALIEGADAAVFAAGAGPGSTAERKDSVDRGAAKLLADAAEKAGVKRFLQISSFSAGEPVPSGLDATWRAYIEAKAAAEEDLSSRSGLDWTILRPGELTDDDPTGHVALSIPPLKRGKIPRADVAVVIAQLLDAPSAVGRTLIVTSGDSLVGHAIAAIR